MTEPRFSSPFRMLLTALVMLARTALVVLALVTFAAGAVILLDGNDAGIFLLLAALGLFTFGIGVLIATRPT